MGCKAVQCGSRGITSYLFHGVFPVVRSTQEQVNKKYIFLLNMIRMKFLDCKCVHHDRHGTGTKISFAGPQKYKDDSNRVL